MNIKITADSTCDLPGDVLERYHITLTPLYIVKDGQPLKDGVEITSEDIFAHVAAGGSLCSTSAVNLADYEELFTALAPQYDGVVHISLGSGFSSSWNNARLAAEELPNVRVVDSRSLSMGQGMVVLEACRLAEECDDLDELCAKLEELTGRVEATFLLDRLDYLAKGGRCPSVVALGANLLKLKPSIEVADNAMRVGRKYRGAFAKCIGEYVRDRLAGRDDLRLDWIGLPQAALSPEEEEAFAAAAEQWGAGFRTRVKGSAGCTISSHCGPHCLGVMTLRA